MLYAPEVQTVVVANNGDIHAFGSPTSSDLVSLSVVGPTNFTIDVWNRAFSSAAIAAYFVNESASKCRIAVASPAAFRVGDPVVVDGTSVAGYNTTHRITNISESEGGLHLLDTDQAYSADATGGTVTLAITGAERELYRVLAQQTASGGLVQFLSDDGRPFMNQDPRLTDGSRPQRYFYLGFSAAGTYRVSYMFRSDESYGF